MNLKRWRKRKRSRLEQTKETASQDTVINLVKAWYEVWLEDPNLVKEDREILPEEGEQKIEILKRKMNKILRKFSQPIVDETRLDDYTKDLVTWLREDFKTSRNDWQEPKIWIDEVSEDYTREMTLKFYVDDIKLEHCERGNRVKSEVRREIIWQLRQVYLYK